MFNSAGFLKAFYSGP